MRSATSSLYGAYTETEAIYRVDRLVALWESLSSADHDAFCFDPATVDWDDYVNNVHLPSIVVHARVRTTPGDRSAPTRHERGRKAILSPDRHLAAFDLENTLIASNVVESYSWLATRHLPLDERVRFTLRTLREAPALLALDRRDRGDFLRHFYRRYDGAPAERLQRTRGSCSATSSSRSRSRPASGGCVSTVPSVTARCLITGALDFVVEPLRPLFDDIVSAPARRCRRAPHR